MGALRMSQAYAVALGARLRAVRRERGMSLQQVEHASGGQWTVIAVGSWERAHRAVTVAKLAGLAEFYGVATEELLPAHSAGPAAAGGRRLTIDLQRLVALPPDRPGRWPDTPQRSNSYATTTTAPCSPSGNTTCTRWRCCTTWHRTTSPRRSSTGECSPPTHHRRGSPQHQPAPPCHPTATEVALERNRTQEQREGRADRPRRR